MSQRSVPRLLARLASLEERTAELEGRLGQGLVDSAPTATHATATPLKRGSRTEAQPDGGPHRVSRARFLGKVGTLVAGAAGAALLEARGTRDAYATVTDTNFVATGIAGGGGIGFATQLGANFDSGAQVAGTSYGINASANASTGSNYGVYATASSNYAIGVAGSARDYGVQGFASGSLYGVGVLGNGAVVGISGYSPNGVGGTFTGGQAAISLPVGPSAGPPGAGPHNPGDVWVDSRSVVWLCTTGGTPGQFTALQLGNSTNPGAGTLYTVVSTQQYKLVNSDGVTWVDLDAANLNLSATPNFNCQAIITGNSDLWTSVAGFNQDFAIHISGGAYGAGQVVAWKESGGFAGTFSPNAAFVQTVQPLVAGMVYTIRLKWKANRAGSSTIWAGAGPAAPFSPTRLTALLILSP